MDQTASQLANQSRQAIAQASTVAQALVREIAGQGPQKTLSRGFALVRSNGTLVTDAQTALAIAADGERIEISFADGTVQATVNKRIEES